MNQYGPFQDVRSQDKIKAYAGVTVPFEESHEKTETDKHHTMNVHKHFIDQIIKIFYFYVILKSR